MARICRQIHNTLKERERERHRERKVVVPTAVCVSIIVVGPVGDCRWAGTKRGTMTWKLCNVQSFHSF